MDKPLSKRATWTSECLSKALEALRNGDSQRKVEKKFKIPRRTLRNHIIFEFSTWFCFACKRCEKTFMRRCMNCQTWFHDACLGYAENDAEILKNCIKCQ